MKTSSDDPLLKILKVRDGSLGEFRDRESPDERIGRNRLLAVPLLRGHWAGNPDANDLIMQKLNCGPQHLRRASELLRTDPEFRDQLDTIMGVKRPPEPVEKPIGDSAPKPDDGSDPKPSSILPPEVVKLLEVVERVTGAGIDAPRSVRPVHELVKVRDVVLVLLTKHLGLNLYEAALILNRDATDVVRAMARMRMPDDKDRRELLQKVCTQLGIDHFLFLARLEKRRHPREQ